MIIALPYLFQYYLKKKLIGKKLNNILEGKARPDYKMKFAKVKGR